MSNALFPTLAGLTWDTVKTPTFNTLVQTAVDGSELRCSYQSTPVWEFQLSYDLLRDDTIFNELKTLGGFFLNRHGKFDSFLFLDDDDSSAQYQVFGTGDGSTTEFQLIRSFGNFTEQVSNIQAGPSVYANAVVANATVGSTGLVTFNSAPAVGANLAWIGRYYYRCRFKEDAVDFNQFMRRLWEAKTVEFIGSLGTKI